MRMLIDVSSVLWMSLLAGKSDEFGYMVEHEGRQVHVNGWQYGLENAVSHITSVMRELELSPSQLIFVVEGKLSKSRRQNIYAGYKDSRSTRPVAAYDEFNMCKGELTTLFNNVGAQVVVNDGVEADDAIAYLCEKLDGEKIILTQDGDLSALISDKVSLYRKGALLTSNPYGPFPTKFITVYKALVGDTSDNIKGAKGFGEKAFLDLLVWGGDAGLAAIEGVIKRRELYTLEDDVAEFKPMRKIIDNAQSVYDSYDVALLYPEWCDTPRQPLQITDGKSLPKELIADDRLHKWAGDGTTTTSDWIETLHPPEVFVPKKYVIFDCEIIGTSAAVFLVCTEEVESGLQKSFWWPQDMDALRAEFARTDLRWISFNGIHFDTPMIAAALSGKDPNFLKGIANALIVESLRSYDVYDRYGVTKIEFDHIDLMEVSPGVKISLKAFAGRMAYKTMVDMPFDHNQDLTPEQLPILEAYCKNDLGVTKALFEKLRAEINLRTELSQEHGIDLRSKSDAQAAEAILKKVANIKGRNDIPGSVEYRAPSFIQTESEVINDIIERIERTQFAVNPAHGGSETPEFLKDPVAFGQGTYQMGIGGLHSTHDKKQHVVATDTVLISDFDVASYYPNIMLKAGLTPRLSNGAGDRFIQAYRDIYDRRMEAKRAGNKKIANALKISLNGTFGKLGSMYSSFYSPDLLLAVTLTGQLNLMCLIYDIEINTDIKVISANTDGIMVEYPASYRDLILSKIVANAVRTGFEYEETCYSQVALKDVNNYLAIVAERVPVIVLPTGETIAGKAEPGKVKRKGLYAETGLMKNPTMEVCSNMTIDFLKDGIAPEESIKNHTDIKDYVAVRTVKGGGIQYEKFVEVDDWILINDLGTKDNEWVRPGWYVDGVLIKASVKRKSRPAPVEIGVGGEQFGRIARWYMQKVGVLPINYVGSGNRVPKTDGAKLCMTLPDELPDDIDIDWYVRETYSILEDIGVEVVTSQ